MQKLAILDYSTGEVHIFNYNDERYGEVEDYLSELNDDALVGRICDLNWMVTDELNLKIH